jgi:hypothetical protein
MACLFGGLACQRTSHAAAVSASPSFTYERRYAPDSFQEYRLTVEYQPIGGTPYSQTTISRHDATARGERITFQGLSRRTGDKQEDWSAIARAFRGYEYDVSTAPDCSHCLALPDLTTLDGRLVEPLTDIHTFLVAVSAQAGVDRVHRVGDRYVNPRTVVGQWSRGAVMPVGEDCIAIEVVLTDLAPTTATFMTSFSPPAARCLTPARPFMTTPVAGAPNNFQQIELKADAREAMWGREQFVVTTTVRRTDGVILDAHMDNELDLVMRTGCSNDSLERCRLEVPVKLRRTVTFQRLAPAPPP